MNRIVIIEDQEDIRDNLEELLELSNYKVISAVNGLEGIAFIRKEKPDLILCDIEMPQMNGYEVLELIRSSEETAKTPFIFISASAQQHDIDAGKMAGADAYLTKPFAIKKLIATIESLLMN